MPQRYFLEIAYHGKNYIGWQVQPTGISVQAKINEAMSLFLRETVNVVGCGRTDTGVHASTFFLHFDADTPLPDDLMNRLNRFLPPDIAVKRLITQIPANTHARFDAIYRAYDYHIHFNKNPFLTEFSFFFPWRPLNMEVIQQAIELLPQYTDFRMFCKTGAGSKTTLCNLYKAEMHLNETNGTLRFHIAANRFLRGMVRRMGLRDLGTNYDNLAVLRPTWMPAILCEGAFVMMPDQEALLRTAEFQEAYALGVVEGVESYFRGLGAR